MGMFLLGVGTVMVLGLIAALVADRQFRKAALEILAALVVIPVLLPLAVIRRGPRCKRMSPAALERFSRQVDSEMRPAWLLSYGGRGVIFVRRRISGGYLGNVSNRAAAAAAGVSTRSGRSDPIGVRDSGQ